MATSQRTGQLKRSRPIHSTYRLQFHRDFPFSSGEALADYLAVLGVSHVYASPILTARAGSLHGYDVIDYDAINPELGGEAGFRSMAAAFRRVGIGIVLDIVPNHVAVGGDDNAMWLDLLKHGRDSRYARWFDVDFDERDPVLGDRIHTPFLGEPLSEALEQGKITVVDDAPRGGFALRYGEHLYPVRPEDDVDIRMGGCESFRDPERLRALIERQHFHLDYWRTASDRLNWRRFFEVTQLAGIRMEEPEAFEAAHRIMFTLYEQGLIDGVRVDHVDGLADPAGYCAKLRDRLDTLAGNRPDWATTGPAWLLVEKILAPGETLPQGWGVDGTTGYDFMDQASAVMHDETGAADLAGFWSELAGRSPSFDDEEQIARREVLEHGFEGQLDYVVEGLMALAGAVGRDADIPRGAMRRATSALACNMRSYRTYLTGTSEAEEAGPFFAEALETARAQPQADHLALDFIAAALEGEVEGLPSELRATVIRRFNQLTSPLAARSVEDTAFYRYGRLISRNDVGFDAARLAFSVAEFHGLMQARAEGAPRSMLALATHDHKRGADVRARLAVISEDAGSWREQVEHWLALNEAVRPEALDRGDEYQLYQMLVGTWPLDEAGPDEAYGERLLGWWRKALREAKLRTGWLTPNDDYEQAADSFLRALLDPARSAAFLASLRTYVAQIAPAGALNGLVQVVLEATVPGLPDTYQGSEFWDFSMVDPDNRRPVDFGERAEALAADADEETLRGEWRKGHLKQDALSRLLRARAERPGLFIEGGYRPLAVGGDRSGDIIAFARETSDEVLVVIVPLRVSKGLSDALELPASWWGDTHVALPPIVGDWQPILGERLALGTANADELSRGLPLRVVRGRRR